jgi:hypothetical protein
MSTHSRATTLTNTTKPTETGVRVRCPGTVADGGRLRPTQGRWGPAGDRTSSGTVHDHLIGDRKAAG